MIAITVAKTVTKLVMNLKDQNSRDLTPLALLMILHPLFSECLSTDIRTGKNRHSMLQAAEARQEKYRCDGKFVV